MGNKVATEWRGFDDKILSMYGLWIEKNEGSNFWMGILNELKNRGVHDCLVAAVDG